jgi:hypothetical protein
MTVATVQDLFVALCEDASVYSMFKTMKGRSRRELSRRYRKLTQLAVFDQIDTLSKAQKSRRSKSLSRSESLISRAGSPETVVRPSSSAARVRVSSESGGSFASAVYVGLTGSTRSSTSEKSRKKLFGRSSIDQDRSSEFAEGLENDTKRSGSFEMMV